LFFRPEDEKIRKTCTRKKKIRIDKSKEGQYTFAFPRFFLQRSKSINQFREQVVWIHFFTPISKILSPPHKK